MDATDFGWLPIPSDVDPKVYRRAVIGSVPDKMLLPDTVRLAPSNAYPIPERFPEIETGSINELVIYQTVERVTDQIAFWNEIYRVCAHGAWVRVTSVYHTHVDATADPTRKNKISERYFGYLSALGRAQLRRDMFEDEIALEQYAGLDFETKRMQHILEPEWEGFSDSTRYWAIQHHNNVVSRLETHLQVYKPPRKEE